MDRTNGKADTPLTQADSRPVLGGDDRGYFTLVFKGNLRGFEGNPLKTETPFGMPVACGYGNAFEQVDALEGMLEDFLDREF